MFCVQIACPLKIAGVRTSLRKISAHTLEAVREDVGTGGVIDSLEGVELIIAAEAHFGVTFTDDEITSQICRSIPQLVAAVAAKGGTTVH